MYLDVFSSSMKSLIYICIVDIEDSRLLGNCCDEFGKFVEWEGVIYVKGVCRIRKEIEISWDGNKCLKLDGNFLGICV